MVKRNYVKPQVESSFLLTNNTFLAVSGELTEEGGTVTEDPGFFVNDMNMCGTVGAEINDFMNNLPCGGDYVYWGIFTPNAMGNSLCEPLQGLGKKIEYDTWFKKDCNTGKVSGKFVKKA